MDGINLNEIKINLDVFLDKNAFFKSRPVEKWRPGLVFSINAPTIEDDDLGSSLFVIMEEIEENLYHCAKISLFNVEPASWDYRLEAADWDGGGFALVETDFTEILPVEALGQQVMAEVSPDALAAIQALYRRYCSDAPALYPDKDEDGWIMSFKQDEEYFMERLHLHIYENWTASEERSAYLKWAEGQTRAAQRLEELQSERMEEPEENFSEDLMAQLKKLPRDFFEDDQAAVPQQEAESRHGLWFTPLTFPPKQTFIGELKMPFAAKYVGGNSIDLNEYDLAAAAGVDLLSIKSNRNEQVDVDINFSSGEVSIQISNHKRPLWIVFHNADNGCLIYSHGEASWLFSLSQYRQIVQLELNNCHTIVASLFTELEA